MAKRIKVRRVLSYRQAVEKTWPDREDAIRGDLGGEGGDDSGVREPRSTPPSAPGDAAALPVPRTDGHGDE